MKQKIILSAGETITAAVGAQGRCFLVRNCSASFIVRGDNVRPIELERGDSIGVAALESIEVENPHDFSITIEYCIADVNLRMQSASEVSNQVAVSEIARPVVVEKILEPLDVTVHQEPVQVQIPPISFPESLEIGNLPKVIETKNRPTIVQALPKITLPTAAVIPKNKYRMAVIIQADINNAEPILIGGWLQLVAGGSATLPASNQLEVVGKDGDSLTIAEVTY